ncbi:MAG: hypothetical protein H0T68_05465 [Gemmatimonadales bacterium]|nr:hypothetical protein [Gemmatimonadales bacterium]
MIGLWTLPGRRAGFQAITGAILLIVGAACGEDGVGPSPTTAAVPADSLGRLPGDSTPAAPIDTTAPAPGDSTLPAPGDSAAAPPDSTALPPVDSIGVTGLAGSHAGILFGSFSMPASYLNSMLTGWMQGGALSPKTILPQLSETRAKGGRAIMKLSMGHDRYVQNDDRTFSLTKWKALVDRFKTVNLDPYLADGTIVGHYLIDEPHRAQRWGGKIISQATLEEMAKHSKRIWPGMATFVRVVPSWLASAPVNYVYLDAGWAQYGRATGDATKWIAAEVAAAKSRGLGLTVGMNVLDGGNGSSGIAGYTKGKYAMSASEIRSIGTALLNQSHACAFIMWTHNLDYFSRSDIKSAMADISAKAKAHARTSCRQ